MRSGKAGLLHFKSTHTEVLWCYNFCWCQGKEDVADTVFMTQGVKWQRQPNKSSHTQREPLDLCGVRKLHQRQVAILCDLCGRSTQKNLPLLLHGHGAYSERVFGKCSRDAGRSRTRWCEQRSSSLELLDSDWCANPDPAQAHASAAPRVQPARVTFPQRCCEGDRTAGKMH